MDPRSFEQNKDTSDADTKAPTTLFQPAQNWVHDGKGRAASGKSYNAYPPRSWPLQEHRGMHGACEVQVQRSALWRNGARCIADSLLGGPDERPHPDVAELYSGVAGSYGIRPPRAYGGGASAVTEDSLMSQRDVFKPNAAPVDFNYSDSGNELRRGEAMHRSSTADLLFGMPVAQSPGLSGQGGYGGTAASDPLDAFFQDTGPAAVSAPQIAIPPLNLGCMVPNTFDNAQIGAIDGTGFQDAADVAGRVSGPEHALLSPKAQTPGVEGARAAANPTRMSFNALSSDSAGSAGDGVARTRAGRGARAAAARRMSCSDATGGSPPPSGSMYEARHSSHEQPVMRRKRASGLTEEMRRDRRRQSNRESARRSRARKLDEVRSHEERIAALHAQLAHRERALDASLAQGEALRGMVASLELRCQQSHAQLLALASALSDDAVARDLPPGVRSQLAAVQRLLGNPALGGCAPAGGHTVGGCF